MTAKVALFTIASKNYLGYVRVLLQSVAAVHPEFKLFLCLADRIDGDFDARAENYRIVQSDALGIPTFTDMTVRYDIMEFNTAIKPYMARWLFEHTDVDRVIYLDPDIRVYGRMDALMQAFDRGASTVLTPHITRPLEDGKTPNDHHMLQAGVFNLGFIGLRRCEEALNYLGWWSRRLATQAVSDPRNNLFTDQRWCDLAPCFLDNLHVLKDAGYNAAYWNLAERDVRSSTKGGWTVNGKPLVFFHFSGVNVDRPQVLSKHQDRFDFDRLPHVEPLFTSYFADLRAQGIGQAKSWRYAYADVDGLPVSPLLRLLYRQAHPEPWQPDGLTLREHLVELANEVEPGFPRNETTPVTRLMRLVHEWRPDLQAVFSLSSAEGRASFAAWFQHAARAEYHLHDDLIPVAAATPRANPIPLERTAPETTSANPLPGSAMAAGTHIPDMRSLPRDQMARTWRTLPRSVQRSMAPWMLSWLVTHPEADEGLASTDAAAADSVLEPSVPEDITTIAILDQPAELPQRLGDQTITRLMYLIWRARPDLQQAFDLSTTEGQAQFVGWFGHAASAEYGLVSTEANAEAAPRSPLRQRVADLKGEQGANLIGYARAEIGMGEHVRMTAAALQGTGVEFGVVNFDAGAAGRQHAVLQHGALMGTARYRANVFHINADQMLNAYSRLGRATFEGRYNIGYWAWELARCPTAWEPVTEMVNEIWAPSRFIRDAFAAVAKVPVVHMPLCVTLPPIDAAYGRSHFGLPTDAYLFLYTFDFLSYIERKNPLAALKAFKSAFPEGRESVRLVIKVMNGDPGSDAWQAFMRSIDGDPRVIVMNQTMQRGEVLGLIDACDCFVSLHRAEGFGRGPAEAMYLGKPVIATNYSGNLDFTKPDNSCLVDATLVPVRHGEYPMHDGQVWADPDPGHAAWHMKRLVADTALSYRLGAAGKACMLENFSPQRVGSLYATRLRRLGLVN